MRLLLAAAAAAVARAQPPPPPGSDADCKLEDIEGEISNVNAACCVPASACQNGAPAQCNSQCAHVFLTFYNRCYADMSALVHDQVNVFDELAVKCQTVAPKHSCLSLSLSLRFIAARPLHPDLSLGPLEARRSYERSFVRGSPGAPLQLSVRMFHPCATTVPRRLPAVSGREVRSSLGIRTSPYRLAGPIVFQQGCISHEMGLHASPRLRMRVVHASCVRVFCRRLYARSL